MFDGGVEVNAGKEVSASKESWWQGNGYSIISAKGRGRLACRALALMSQTQRHSSPNYQGESHTSLSFRVNLYS